VIALYLLANVAYLCLLPLDRIQHAPDDRVATAAIETVFSGAGAAAHGGGHSDLDVRMQQRPDSDRGAGFITPWRRTGCFSNPPADSTPPRARGGFAAAVSVGLLLVLPRTRLHDASGAENYGNLYSDLLDYVVFATLVFYVLTIIGIFVLRRRRPGAEKAVSHVRVSGSAGALCCRSRRYHAGVAAVQDADNLARSVDRAGRRAGVFCSGGGGTTGQEGCRLKVASCRFNL